MNDKECKHNHGHEFIWLVLIVLIINSCIDCSGSSTNQIRIDNRLRHLEKSFK